MQIYYARGNEVNDSKHESFLKSLVSAYNALTNEYCDIVRHDRNRSGYNPQLLIESDCVIMITAYPKERELRIGVGLYREIHTACQNNIPVYVMHEGNFGVKHLYKIDDTALSVVKPELWTAGHAIIDLCHAIYMECVEDSGSNMRSFWKCHLNSKTPKTKPENKGGDKQNEDSGKRILLLG